MSEGCLKKMNWAVVCKTRKDQGGADVSVKLTALKTDLKGFCCCHCLVFLTLV